MKKEEFLKKLEESLAKLNEQDLKKVLRKYKTIFTRKQNKGKTDQTIIEEFGDFSDLVNNILKEHGIETPIQESANTINDFFNQFLKVIEYIVNYIAKKDVKEIVILILKLLLTLIFISFLKLPFLFIRDLATGIFSLLFIPLSTVLIFCFRFILELLYILVAISSFVTIFEIIVKPSIKK